MKSLIYNQIKKWIAVLLPLILLSSCGTYNEVSQATELNLLNSNFAAASASLETNKMLQKERNRLLYLLEKGKLEHINKNFEASNNYFEQAYYLIEDRGSNTGSKIAAAFTNPESIPYPAEDFEKTTVHYYKALNFFQLGQYDNALVEAKRINIKLNRLNENYKEGKNRYDEDAFAHILQGLIYEAKGDINDAFIAYRNAADCYLRNGNAYFGVPIPQQLKKDVVRTAALLNFGDERRKYEELFNITYDGNKAENEAVIFWENGLGPYKSQTKISLTAVGGLGAGTFQNEEYGIVVPIPTNANLGITAVAFPKYLNRDPYYARAELSTGNQIIPFETVENFGEIAQQCLKDRMGREIKDVIIRVVTKKAASKGVSAIANKLGGGLAGKLAGLATDAVNAATEKADTRNWQSLPNTISYVRVPIKKEEPLTLNLYTGTTQDQIQLIPSDKSGIQLFNHVTFGREMGGTTSSGSYDAPATTQAVSYDTQPTNTNTIAVSNLQQLAGATTQRNNNNNNTPSYTEETPYKRVQFGFGARTSVIDNNFLTVRTIEPEFEFYNNAKRIGFSASYGFILSNIDEFESFVDFNKIATDLNIGFSTKFGMVIEGQTSWGAIDTFSEQTGFFEYSRYTSLGGGLGAYFKGNGRKGIAMNAKIIAGYDAANLDRIEFVDTSNSIYLTVGYSILF